MTEKTWDVFICHASQDKELVARPLAEALTKAGVRVWLDEAEITLGDIPKKKIDDGLAKSRYGVVILSPDSLEKYWTGAEMSALEALEETRGKVILPVWHNITQEYLAERSPIMASRFAAKTADGISTVTDEILKVLGKSRTPKKNGHAFDLSHGQNDWEGLTTSIKRHHEFSFEAVEKSLLSFDLKDTSVLVVALPRKQEFATNGGIDRIKSWVENGGGLLLLGYYFADSHHGSNPNELARAFGFQFSNDLLMPVGRTSRRDCQDQAFERGDELSVEIQVDPQDAGPISDGINNVALLSACSIGQSVRQPDFFIKTPICSIVHAEGRPDRNGYLLQITNYVEASRDAATVLAGWSFESGRVVAVGTWKIATMQIDDNAHLFRYVIRWLSGQSNTE